MDSRLKERLNKIGQRIDQLKKVEKEALFLEAHKKVLYSQLFLKAKGKSIAEREANVYASQDWQEFISGLIEAQTNYNEAKRLYELNQNAYLAEHATYKIEASAIQKGVGS